MKSIKDISMTENAMIVSSNDIYGEFYTHAERLVQFSFHFLKTVKPNAQVFVIFLSQVNKSLSLSLLSSLRRHDVQAQLMLRHVLESAVLATYSLYETDINQFAYIDNNDYAHERPEVKVKAHNWLEENYSIFNDKIKFMKTKVINKNTAHANIITAFNNYDFSNEEKFVTTLFDPDDPLIIKQRLWWIANISFGLLDMFFRISKNIPIINVNDDFEKTMFEFGRENKRLEEILRSDERLARHFE
ncbi:hypothetical protein [Paenibacillus sp. R14(2021)]|uniref:hypothetical protein n=1 Tax=Paenibacillus sp. R14(2021) TaxID=2859228 RepID=UPI001C61585C|nr:hypothetical protein [Paenibacillus sp. R14(2021)]